MFKDLCYVTIYCVVNPNNNISVINQIHRNRSEMLKNVLRIPTTVFDAINRFNLKQI
jgi:hypothetical protein